MTKKKANPSKGGRQSEYKPEFAEQVKKLLMLNSNTTDTDIAKFFGKAESTISKWKVDFPEFSEAIRAGKTPADSNVAAKLYDRAIGAEYFEEEAIKVKTVEYGEDGKKIREKEEVKIVKVRRCMPPDTMAISLWLRNRRADAWRATPDPMTGDDTVQPVKIELKVIDATKKPLPDANA